MPKKTWDANDYGWIDQMLRDVANRAAARERGEYRPTVFYSGDVEPGKMTRVQGGGAAPKRQKKQA